MSRRFILIACASLTAGVMPVLAADAGPSGKQLVLDSSKGNCVACHSMPTVAEARAPGNSGAPLIAMSARFPDKAGLRALIWDASRQNPRTFMPPYGRHKILSEAEIDRVVDYIYGL